MAHSNTIFNQLLQLVDRHDFKKIEKQYRPKRKYRCLDRWNQFSVMLFAQITNRSGLRSIVEHFRFHSKRLYHMGLKPVKRSTLADANAQRSPELFEALFGQLFNKCATLAPGHKFRFKNKLYSLDASTIDLCLSLFSWARFRKTKAGIKLHALLDHDSHLPAFIQVTDAKVHEIRVAKALNLPAGSIVAIDKAYIDFNWLNKLHRNRCFFVTRIKTNTRYRVTERRNVSKNKGLTSDQTIILTGTKAHRCPIKLRRIGYIDPESKKQYFFLTNNFKLAAKTIADIYHQRWQVEIFFKWVKQHLKIKTFFGTTRNAVLTQIWTALIALLILALYKYRARLGLSLSEILQLLQLNLFEKRNLWALFEEDVPLTPYTNQLLFDFMYL